MREIALCARFSLLPFDLPKTTNDAAFLLPTCTDGGKGVKEEEEGEEKKNVQRFFFSLSLLMPRKLRRKRRRGKGKMVEHSKK